MLNQAVNGDVETIGPDWYENAFHDLRTALMCLDADWAWAVHTRRPFDLATEVNKVIARYRYLSEWLEPSGPRRPRPTGQEGAR